MKKTCFIITPLGNENSDIRRKAEGVIDNVINPVLSDFDIEVILPHKIDVPGSITNQVIKHILKADLVVANLTGLNPNVMYELAIRHAKRLPVISIVENGTLLPFDINNERTIFYTDDIAEVSILKNQLTKFVDEAINDKNPDNPIYRAVESLIIQEFVISKNDEVQSYVLNRLDEISSQLNRILFASKLGDVVFHYKRGLLIKSENLDEGEISKLFDIFSKIAPVEAFSFHKESPKFYRVLTSANIVYVHKIYDKLLAEGYDVLID